MVESCPGPKAPRGCVTRAGPKDLRVGPEGSWGPGAGEEGAGRGRRSVPAKTPARRMDGCEESRAG